MSSLGEPFILRAELSGVVEDLCASPGKDLIVAAGRPLLVVSSMKMLIDVLAPMDCIVRSYSVAKGDAIKVGDALAVICASVAPTGADPHTADVPAAERAKSEQLSAHGHNEELGRDADWSAEVEELRSRRAKLKTRQRNDGKRTVRERAALLLDSAAFHEFGEHAGVWEDNQLVPANFFLATGRINGSLVVVGGEDFTVRGGSPNLPGLRKSRYCEELALELRVPLIRLHEGAGGSVAGAGGARKPGGTAAPAKPARPSGEAVNDPHRFRSIGQCFETVPVASAVLGSVAGLPAVRVAMSHFVVMLNSAALLVAGTRVIEQARGGGTALSKEQVGGADVHHRTGVVDVVVASEEEAVGAIRRFLSYLPSHSGHRPPKLPEYDPRSRRQNELRKIVPTDRRKPFNVRELLEHVIDSDSLFELKRGMARSVIVGFARLAGHVVGVVANDCIVDGGSMTAMAAQKLCVFISLCERFHVPLVHFVDEPGFMVGAEDAGTLHYGARAAHSAALSGLPTATVLVRRCFGVATYCHIGSVAPLVLAWPSSLSGPMPVQAGVEVAFRRQLEAAEDPGALRQELERQVEARLSVWPRAEAFGVHDLIDPSETRHRLCDWLDSVQHRLDEHVAASVHDLCRYSSIRSRF